jgi:hypothetical protein
MNSIPGVTTLRARQQPPATPQEKDTGGLEGVVTLLLHCCYTVARHKKRTQAGLKVLLHCCYTVVTLLLHCCPPQEKDTGGLEGVVTLLLHCCHNVVTLLLHFCYTVITLLLATRKGHRRA